MFHFFAPTNVPDRLLSTLQVLVINTVLLATWQKTRERFMAEQKAASATPSATPTPQVPGATATTASAAAEPQLAPGPNTKLALHFDSTQHPVFSALSLRVVRVTPAFKPILATSAAVAASANSAAAPAAAAAASTSATDAAYAKK